MLTCVVNHVLGEWWYTPEDYKSSSTPPFECGFPLYASSMKSNAMVVSKRTEDGEAVFAAVVLEYDPKKQGGIY
jgi:hypothetical protein